MSEERRVSHPRSKGRDQKLWRKYLFEVVGLAALGLGIFLLLEQTNLRETLRTWCQAAALRWLGHYQQFQTGLDVFLAQVSLSDAIGGLLVVGAMVAMLLRVRWRLLTSVRLTNGACPTCGAPLHRIHRTRIDHLISAFVPVQRYRCQNDACHWRGLRVRRRGRQEHHRSAALHV